MFQKPFLKESAAGRVIHVFILYFFYFLLFYLILPMLIILLQGGNFGGVPFFILIFLVAPALSYKIINYLKPLRHSRRTYVFHTIFVVLLPFVYSFILFRLILSNMNYGGF